MTKTLMFLKTLLSRIRLSFLLTGSMLFMLATLISDLQNVGTKWMEIQILLIYLFVGFCGLVIFLRRNLDFLVFRIVGKSAIRVGIVFMCLSLISSTLLVLSFI